MRRGLANLWKLIVGLCTLQNAHGEAINRLEARVAELEAVNEARREKARLFKERARGMEARNEVH
jgi:hypothetical protein